jgi:hypothetical protein
MELLHKGGTRRTAFLAAVALGTFQALAIVGAMPASAVVPGDCTYNPATDTVQVLLEDGETAVIGVVDPGDEIQITASAGGASDCGSATVANTVAVVVLGSGINISDELFVIDNDNDGSFGAIAFSIDMGAGTGDEVEWDGTDGDDTATITNDTFVTNGGTGELVGTEFVSFFGNDGDDVLDGSGTTTQDLELHGQNGDDTVTGGGGDDLTAGGPDDDTVAGGNGDDFVEGGPGTDFINEGTAPNGADELNGSCVFCFGPDEGDEISYAGRTASVNVSLNASFADADDGEGCVEDAPAAGCEGDEAWNFAVIATGSGNDTLEGDESAGFDETMIGNAGDDVMDGNGGGFDFASWRDSAGPITVDTAAGTATGDAVTVDSWTETEGVDGSANTDDLLNFSNETGPNEVSLCDGEADATSFEFISGSDLGVGNDIGEAPLCTSTFEHVTGSPGNDFIEGDSARNTLDGNAGNDVIDGLAGNDTLIGAAGNDTFTGGIGADTVSFATNTTAGVQADLSLGFATSSDSGDDAFTDLLEIVIGSPFNDQITGGPFAGGGTINFLFKGGAGKDRLTGFSGNDTLNGGAGKDTLRGVAGDDTLLGKKGNDLLAGGGGFDIGNGGKGKDVCKGVEQRRSCGSSQHPAAPQTAVGKLS